jgi:hypothetical protein
VTTVSTLGNGNFSENNFKVQHHITGNIDPLAVAMDTNKVSVCRGTSVSIVITDETGMPNVRAESSGISCEGSECSITNIQSKQRYRARSSDRKDTDNMQIQVLEDQLPRGD